MANKRMFSKQITTSDAFVDMPTSSQLLYFHLNMEADDDGFVANPKRISKMVGSNDDDLKILLAKRFLLAFDSGVMVIKHWLLHNTIRKDMYQETQYIEEKKQLQIKDNKVYTEIRNESVTVPLHRLDKIRLDKDRIEQNNTSLIKKKDSSLKKEKILDIETLPNWLDKEVWNNWVSYKKEKREKLTDNTIKLQLKELAKDIPNHKLIIEQSIRNGWKGLFPIKNLKQTNKLLEVTDKYDKYENNK